MNLTNCDKTTVYDFDSLVDRFDHGSIKWENAKHIFTSDGNLDNLKFSGRPLAVSTADMDFKIAPEIVAAICETAAKFVYGYTVPTAKYFDAVISWLERRHKVMIERSWISLSPGVVAAIHYAISEFTNPDDGVIVQMPVYRPFHASVRSLRRRIVNNMLVRDGKSYKIDFDDFERKAAEPATKMFILCNPHNPVGRVWTIDELEKIASICTKHGVIVISDEIHADIVFSPYKHASYCLLPQELWKNAIICTSPSKSFNMCGLQISNIIIRDTVMRQNFVRRSYMFGFHAPNCFAAAAAIAAYNRAEDWLDQMLRYVYGNYEMVKEFIETKIPQIEVMQLQGTYLQWLNFEALGITGHERENLLRHKAGIFFESGYIFGEGGDAFERLNLAYPKSFLNELLQRLLSIN
ncbi:MAG: PatB family C-S lyase [Planctomycetaceae bacterium]|jgi:putative C-S lyase|nr:PatB family C-S lyase [Planctomycetaceae bacterium]